MLNNVSSKENDIKGCDMVLALAEPMINHQFENLWKRPIRIADQVDIDKDDGKTKIHIHMDAKSNIMKEGILTASVTTQGEFGSEVTHSFETSVGAPHIEIIEHGFCNFFISFINGKFIGSNGQQSYTLPFENISYTFRVPIGETSIKKTHVVTDEGEKQIDDFLEKANKEGLSQTDFTINQLLMDFSNLNIIESSESHGYPKEWKPGNVNSFRELVESYFKNVQASKTPYVLGYGFKLKEKKDTSLFVPTGRKYGTTYHKAPAYSSVNFMMMAFGNSFPENEDYLNLLPGPLKDIRIDDPKKVPQGVFGIDYNLFKEKLIIAPNTGIISVIEKNLNEIIGKVKSGDYDKSGWFVQNNRHIVAKEKIQFSQNEGGNEFTSNSVSVSAFSHTTSSFATGTTDESLTMNYTFDIQINLDGDNLRLSFRNKKRITYLHKFTAGRGGHVTTDETVEDSTNKGGGFDLIFKIEKGSIILSDTEEFKPDFIESGGGEGKKLVMRDIKAGRDEIAALKDVLTLKSTDISNKLLDALKETVSIQDVVVLPFKDVYMLKDFISSNVNNILEDGSVLYNKVTYINNWDK